MTIKYVILVFQVLLVTNICLDIGISHVEKGNKHKAFYSFVIWFVYLVTATILYRN